MAEKTSIHIADDPGRLEEFVLGRLGDIERVSVEKHSASCERCAQAIRTEQTLAAGVKSLGREVLKENLRRRLARTLAPAGIPWPRILSAAAVLAILFGVGWLNHWFLATETEPAMITEKLTETDAPVAGGATPSPTAVPRADRGQAEEYEASPRPSERTAKAEHPRGGLDDRLRPEGETPSPARNETAEIAAAGARSEVVTQQDLKIAAEPPAPAERFWLEGNSIAVPSATDAAFAGAKDDALRKRKSAAQVLAEKETNAPAATGTVAAQSIRNYRVLQRSSAALPEPRQNMQQMNTPRAVVQTLVEQRPGETILTLYLDSLVDLRELRNARVDPVARDSVIVNIGNQRIGYRLPGQNQFQQQIGK